MLDIKYIRENKDKALELLNKRGDFDLGQVIEIDERRREVMAEVEKMRSEQNVMSDSIATASPEEREEKVKEAKSLKEKLSEKESELAELEGSFRSSMIRFPNIPFEDVPEGDEENNVVLRKVGAVPEFSFEPKDHLDLGKALDVIDVERAAKVSGSRFAYLKGDLVLLEFALVQLAMREAMKENFIPVVPPVLIKAEMMQSMGSVDTEEDLAERYLLDKDGMFLVGTAEQSVGPMHASETFDAKDLPKRYVAFSSCFREEAGSYGKDTRGILRVHQFDKVEFFSFSHPDNSKDEHAFLVEMEERLWKKLDIPYQVVQLAAGDMGRPAASTIDLEAWMPGQDRYREVSSASNTTDYQARRLNVRYRDDEGAGFVHMLNATGFPIGRTIIAIMENYQQEDGRIAVPDALKEYIGKDLIG